LGSPCPAIICKNGKGLQNGAQETCTTTFCYVLLWWIASKDPVSYNQYLSWSQLNAVRRSQIVSAHIKNRSQRAMEKVQECIALEQEEPMTSNEHYLEDYKSKYMARYKAMRRNHVQHGGQLQTFMRGGFQGTDIMHSAIQNLQAMGLPASEDALMRLFPPDPIDNAIQIMAECRAYYQGEILPAGSLNNC
jgi:hypothetical protein